MEEHDAVIVGARCAGSTLANALAERDWDVVMVDRDTFPSTTISTHGIWPNGLARLDELGILATLEAGHELTFLKHRFVGLGNDINGGFTPIGGFDRALAPRRIALDKAGVDTALAKGAKGEFGARVVDLIGSGTPEDPVSGVVLADGRELRARWVFGCDGRGSLVANKLRIPKERQKRGEIAISYSYWKGIPPETTDGHGTLVVELDGMLYMTPVEDGLTMLIANGPPEIAEGSKAERERKHLEFLRGFPDWLDGALLDSAEMVTEVEVAPEPLMQGFYRKPTGPGWALVGDSAHFKHPGTAQGIGDAIEQAVWVAEALSGSDASLDGYADWIDERSAEHYDWSFAWGSFPRKETAGPMFKGWAAEADAGQDLRDCLARTKEPSELMTKERLARWFDPALAS